MCWPLASGRQRPFGQNKMTECFPPCLRLFQEFGCPLQCITSLGRIWSPQINGHQSNLGCQAPVAMVIHLASRFRSWLHRSLWVGRKWQVANKLKFDLPTEQRSTMAAEHLSSRKTDSLPSCVSPPPAGMLKDEQLGRCYFSHNEFHSWRLLCRCPSWVQATVVLRAWITVPVPPFAFHDRHV